jgi:hypothetical protein
MYSERARPSRGLVLATITAASIFLGNLAFAGPLATISGAGNAVSWTPTGGAGGLVVNLSHPDGAVTSHNFSGGQTPSVGGLADGHYTYEIVAIPKIPAWARDQLAEARASGDMSIVAELREAGVVPAERQVQSGSFTIQNGSLVNPNLAE